MSMAILNSYVLNYGKCAICGSVWVTFSIRNPFISIVGWGTSCEIPSPFLPNGEVEPTKNWDSQFDMA